MNCLDLEIAIMHKFNIRQNLIVPNVTDMSWLVAFETDMLVLTPSGYAHGFEIKISKSDLLADFKKKQHINIDKTLSNGKKGMDHYFGKFKYFSYVVPEFLKEDALNTIPKFCGLYVCIDYNTRHIIKEIRSPKKLYNYKWSYEQKYQLARLGAMRIYGLKCGIRNLLCSNP
jgi:hypothetical protein